MSKKDDLLSMEIDDGAPIDKDYEEEVKEPGVKEIILGHGKAKVSCTDLIVTSPNVFAPSEYKFRDADGKEKRSGHYSNSSLNTYRRCQRQFYYAYVEGIRPKKPAPKMWGGVAIHDALEYALQARIDNPEFDQSIRNYLKSYITTHGKAPDKFSLGDIKEVYQKSLPFSNEKLKEIHRSRMIDMVSDYENAKVRAATDNTEPLPDIDWGKDSENQQMFSVKFYNAVDAYIQKEYPLVNPKKVEECMIYHFPLHSGGTVPIVGFIDLEEEADFMSEYYNEVYKSKTLDETTKEYAKGVIKNIDNGELIITDHKSGRGKTYEDARIDQQLTLYSLAKDIPNVAFNSIKLGTNGGKRPDRAKPATIQKVFGKRTDKDYEALIDDFNHIIKGISAGIFDKTGTVNSMVCSPTQCPYYRKCFR